MTDTERRAAAKQFATGRGGAMRNRRHSTCVFRYTL